MGCVLLARNTWALVKRCHPPHPLAVLVIKLVAQHVLALQTREGGCGCLMFRSPFPIRCVINPNCTH